MRLDQRFDVKNGIASTSIDLLTDRIKDSIPFVRPASTQQRTIAGWIRRAGVDPKHIYPAGSLFVSTNGEGSHTFAYVSSFDFVPNSDVSVLIPKEMMTVQEKLFFARAITMNRYKFSYGRKPKGIRLQNIVLPDTIPNWVNVADITDAGNDCISSIRSNSIDNKTYKNCDLTSLRALEPLSEIFDIRYGTNL